MPNHLQGCPPIGTFALMIDAIVIGQGIAGTAMSYRLLSAGLDIIVIDAGHQSAASHVAAGLINPITGRKYVKSWMIDDLLPAATRFYSHISELIESRVIDERTIIRSLHTAEDENQWYSRLDQSEYDRYLIDPYDGPDYSPYLRETFGYGRIRHSMSIDTAGLLRGWRDYLSDRGALLEERYIEEDLQIVDDHIHYHGIDARRIFYCAGWRDSLSTLWEHLPYRPAKGEALIVKIPDMPRGHIIKHHRFLVPQSEDDAFWLGGTYAWDTTIESPTSEKYDELKTYLDSYLKVSYEILDHRAAIRPATKYRRPFVGTHPEHKNIHILGGLGTKGFSLAPYWSSQLMKSIYDGSPLSEEIPSLTF